MLQCCPNNELDLDEIGLLSQEFGILYDEFDISKKIKFEMNCFNVGVNCFRCSFTTWIC